MLGFFQGGLGEGKAWFESGDKDGDGREKAQALAEERVEARSSKDWARADQLRDSIAELGYEVQDTPQGPVLIPKKN